MPTKNMGHGNRLDLEAEMGVDTECLFRHNQVIFFVWFNVPGPAPHFSVYKLLFSQLLKHLAAKSASPQLPFYFVNKITFSKVMI